MTETLEPTSTDPPTPVSLLTRVRLAVLVVSVAFLVLVPIGSFVTGNTGSFAYVASLGMSALVVLIAATQQLEHGRAWRLIGVGFTIWAITGCIVTVQVNADFDGIPDLVVSLGYSIGYLPVMIGFAELADNRLRVRRLSSFVDGFLVFLVLYGVVWLLVVEQIAVDASFTRVDRAFMSLYPAGDLALLMLAIRIATSRTMRRRVVALLIGGSVLLAVADVWLLVGYLRDPDGSYPITDAAYLTGLAAIAVASIWCLLPSPPASVTAGGSWRWVSMAVAASAVVPPLVLLGVVLTTDRQVSVTAVAVWLVFVVVTMVARNLAGVRELERAHQQASWLASHDVPTGMLQRVAFLHEVAEGSLRDRSGTVIVVEVQGVRDLADRYGFEASEYVLDTVAVRLRTATGGNAILARMGHDQFVAFLRSGDLGHGRQVAAAVQKALREPVSYADQHLPLFGSVGVAQADGAVIDVLAGVRRATEAMHHARSLGSGGLAFDADLAGRMDGNAG